MKTKSNRTEDPSSALTVLLRKFAPALIVLAGVAVVAILVVALPAKSRQAPATEPAPVNVEVELVQPIPELPDAFVQHAVVEPNRIVMVAAEVSGQIESIGLRNSDLTVAGRTYLKGQPVVEGEPIAKGDCIVVLNTDLLQAEHDRAKAQAEYSQREYARMLDLREKNVAAQKELDQAKMDMEVSRATLAEASEKLRRTKIVAPIAGILNDLPEEVGQFVQPGAFVAEIVDISVVKVVVDVSEKDIHYLNVGDKAEVLVDPRGGCSVYGQITFISELADKQARTTRVEISVLNEPKLLRSGQGVRVVLVRQILTDVIMIPLAAAIPLENGYVVYVVQDGVARRRPVQIDLTFIKGVKALVTSGLASGDQLIVTGHRYVGDGQKVIVRNNFTADTPAAGSMEN